MHSLRGPDQAASALSNLNHRGSIYPRNCPSSSPCIIIVPHLVRHSLLSNPMRSSTQSTLTLCFAIFPSFLRAQEYTCTGSCANCPSYTSEYGGPFVAQEFCVDGENCFGAYQCFLTYGAPNVLIDDTQGGSWSDWSEGENVADCCTPPSDGSCDFAPSGTGSGLTGLDLNGTVQSSTNTILNAQALEDTFCPPYCADCVEGKYHSTLNYGNTYYTCNIGCGNENESEPPQCIPPVPDTCTSAENPIKAGNCSVEILQYSPASKTQDWWAFNIYFYDALWVSLPTLQDTAVMIR